jgi:hypothetical protein
MKRRVVTLRIRLALLGAAVAWTSRLAEARTDWDWQGILVAVYLTGVIWFSDPQEEWLWGENGQRTRRRALILIPTVAAAIGLMILFSSHA